MPSITQIAALLAYAAITPKTQWTDADKALLQRIADRYIPVGQKVTRDTPLTAMDIPFEIPAFTGTVTEVGDNDRITITLDTPVEIDDTSAAKTTVTEVTVNAEAVEKVPAAA